MLNNRASQMPLPVILLLLCLPQVPFLPVDVLAATSTVTTSIVGNAVGKSTTQVIPPPTGGNVYGIQGGQAVGKNLFHSFSQFNVGPGDIAQFQTSNLIPTTGVNNVLGRITGMSPSSIFGTIDSATYYPAANLFLMNANGFLFGANATVNVGGMMVFTTADYLKLADGGRFNANPSAIPTDVLTSAPVVAFGFLGANPGAITFEGGQLSVANGTGLTLVGGNITLMPGASDTPSSITAPGRPVTLTSVAGPGEVNPETGIPAAAMALGTVTLGQGSILSTASDLSFGDGSGGSISIRGGQLIATGATITTSPAAGSPGIGGGVTIDVTGSATFTDSTIQTSPVLDFSFTGSGGPVSISANQDLTMTRSTIDTSAFFAGGNAGSVTLNSLNGSVSLADSRIATFASAPGNGGAVSITGKDASLTRSSIDTGVDTGLFDLTIDDPALGLVHPGAVTIIAQNTVTIAGSDPGTPVISAIASGTLLDGGSVTIVGKTVYLSNGSIITRVNEGTVPSPGNGGPIEIRGNNVNLSGFTLESINAGFDTSTGKGGSILLRGADSLLANNIQLTSSIVDAASVSGGGGGSIQFQTQSLTLSNSSLLRTGTLASGAGGTITIGGADNVTVESGSLVQTNSIGNALPMHSGGKAGEIVIETQNLAVLSGGQISAQTSPRSAGDAGNITIHGTNGSSNSILINGSGSGIFTDTQGTGQGGNISVRANSVSIANGGALSAKTSGTVPTATGGSIFVNANTVSLSSGGTMTASSTGAGAAGNITVQGLASPSNSVIIDGSGSGILTTAEGTGAGGNISINANSVALQNGARVSSSSTGTGVAGDITINAGHQLTMTNSSVTTEANNSSGGAIKITTNPDGNVQLINSVISASVHDGTGGGGSVNIDPDFVVLTNSSILANAEFGPGGNILITTNLLLPDSTSVIQASSAFGQQGTITIQSPVAPASGKIVPLGQKPLIAASLLNQRCAALAGGNISSFTVAGRDRLPAEPSAWLSSPLALEPGSGIKQIEAKSELDPPLLSLRQIAPPGFLTQVFAAESDCQS